MSNYNSDGPSDNDWEDRGELIWNEFDWEKYLQDQDEVILSYLAHYEKLKGHPERLDEAARRMGWRRDEWSTDPTAGESREEDDATTAESDEAEPYTIHKNPVFIATRALHISLQRVWERLAADPRRVPQPLALRFLGSLHRAEDQAVFAIHALDFGDYAMAISLFKRALSAINTSMAELSSHIADQHKAVVQFREQALVRLFDLREVWLRVMAECRSELEQPLEDEDDGE